MTQPERRARVERAAEAQRLAVSGSALVSVALVALATTLEACAPIPAPRELVVARAAFRRAQTATPDAPVEVDHARRALGAAEQRFQEIGAEPEVSSLAFVAERQAQRAESAARRVRLERELTELTAAAKARAVARDVRAREAEAKARDELARKTRELEAAAQLAGARREAEERAQRATDALRKIATAVRTEPRGVVLTFAEATLFAQGATAPSPGGRAKLDELATTLQRDRPGVRTAVEAHTDNQRSKQQNARLSKARAEAVAAYLAKKGLSGVRAEGLGEQRPLASNSTTEGRLTNRRVEIVLEP